ncbi:MAG: class I SAM-dependent methyltransferase [Planctomycetota bacterium]
MSASADPWFVEAFRSQYRRVYPHRDLESARSEVRHLIEAGLPAPTLDLCCGFGRHTLALREEGRAAVGMDLSTDLLREAPRLPRGPELLGGRLARADARRLPFRAGSFAGVCMLFSSFGYFDDRANAGVLSEVRRVLAPGGVAVFDLMNAERIRSSLVPESHTERDGLTLRERRALVDGGRRVTKEVTLTDPSGRTSSWREDVRLFDPAEFDALCAEAGLTTFRREGDFAPTAFGPTSPRQIVWTRRETAPPA